jgi:hypothetical protein
MGMAVATGLSRKLKKVLECRTESPNLVSSLKTLSTLYTENTPRSRCNIRYNIETCGLQINLDFLHASDAAQKALDLVEEQVNALSDCCDKIAKALESCSGSTRDIISTTKRLKQELEITSLNAMDNAHAFLFI